jgi:hypothetical protein
MDPAEVELGRQALGEGVADAAADEPHPPIVNPRPFRLDSPGVTLVGPDKRIHSVSWFGPAGTPAPWGRQQPLKVAPHDGD